MHSHLNFKTLSSCCCSLLVAALSSATQIPASVSPRPPVNCTNATVLSLGTWCRSSATSRGHCFRISTRWSLLLILSTFLHSYVERCQMLSDNQSRLHLNSCSSTGSSHWLPFDVFNWSFHPLLPRWYPLCSAGNKSWSSIVWSFFCLLFFLGSGTWLLTLIVLMWRIGWAHNNARK